MFNTQSSSSFLGGITFISDPSQAFTSHSIETPFVGDEALEHLRQFGQLNAVSLRSFDSSSHGGDSSAFRTLAPASLQSLSEGFLCEYSPYGVLPAPTAFYDPAALMNVSLEAGQYDNEHGIFSGMEEAYGGRRQLESSPAAESRRGKVVGMRGDSEEYGTQKNEKKRRKMLVKKFELLKALIPNPTKTDKVTILSDTIAYIKNLLMTLEELKLLVMKKRRKNPGSLKLEMEDEVHCDKESSSIKPIIGEEGDPGLNGSPRSSWIQRRSISTFVDVRAVEDEVFIKLEQAKRADCTLIVSRVLDELQLELIHFSGGDVGNCQVFMISTKLQAAIDGSPVHASSVARSLVEAMDG